MKRLLIFLMIISILFMASCSKKQDINNKDASGNETAVNDNNETINDMDNMMNDIDSMINDVNREDISIDVR